MNFQVDHRVMFLTDLTKRGVVIGTHKKNGLPYVTHADVKWDNGSIETMIPVNQLGLWGKQ